MTVPVVMVVKLMSITF